MNTAEKVEIIRKRLKEAMSREIPLMRELLSSLSQEQEAHLSNAPELLRSVIRQRELISEALTEARQARVDIIYELADLSGRDVQVDGEINEEKCFALIMEYAGSESCEILLLRDQMLALLEQLRTISARNNYLIQHKLDHTKNLLSSLQPHDPNTLYGVKGRKRIRTATLPIVNQEV